MMFEAVGVTPDACEAKLRGCATGQAPLANDADVQRTETLHRVLGAAEAFAASAARDLAAIAERYPSEIDYLLAVMYTECLGRLLLGQETVEALLVALSDVGEWLPPRPPRFMEGIVDS